MRKELKIAGEVNSKFIWNLPKALKAYETSAFKIQQKAKFIYYLCIAIITFQLFILISTSYLQLTGDEYHGIYFPIIIPELCLVLFYVFCIVLLIKGYYGIASHLTASTSMFCAWFIMWVDNGNIIIRLDTVVIIVSLLNIIPLIITKHKSTILLYIIINLAILYCFILFNNNQLNLSFLTRLDYLLDTTVAILFAGILGYNIFQINEKILEKANIEIKDRKLAEQELKKSKEQFESLVSNIPGTTYRCKFDKEWTMLFISSEIEKLSGFQPGDFINNTVHTYESLIIEEDKKLVSTAIEEAVKIKQPWEIEYRIKNSKGQIRWVYEKGRAGFGIENKVDYLDGFILDITEKKIAETTLKDNEIRYRTLFENARIGIYQTTTTGKILSANSALIKMLDYSSFEELTKIKLEHDDVFVDNARKTFIELMDENGWVNNLESKWITKKGEDITIIENARAVKDITGKILYYEGFVEDITSRKKNEDELRQSEETFKNLIEFAPFSISINDFDGRFLMINKAFAKNSGYTAEEIIGKTPAEVYLNFEKDKEDLIRKELHEKRKIDNIETFFTDKNHKRIDVYYSGQIVQFMQKQVIISSTTDISEKKRVELGLEKYSNQLEATIKIRTGKLLQHIEELKLTQESLEKRNAELNQLQLELLKEKKLTDALMVSIPDVIYFKDIKSQFIMVSKSKFRSHNMNVESEILGKTDFDFFTEEHAVRAYNDEQEIIKTGKPIVDLIEKETWKDGRITFASTTKMPLFDPEGKIIGTFGISRDITKLVEMESAIKVQNQELIAQRAEMELILAELQQAQEQLVHAEKMASLGVLAAGVAHEINNPLNFINGGIVGLESYFNENLKEHLQEVYPLIYGIQVGVSRAAAIVTSLNHYNRHNASSVIQCDINSIIDNCLVMLQSETKNRIEIIRNYGEKKLPLNCSESKLHQAFLNILTNACQSIQDKGTIIISTKAESKDIIVTFTDSGCGIPEENLSRIMDPFFTTKEPGKGTGLGLSITYNIIKEHDGTIEISSKIGQGTLVKICLHNSNS